MARHQGLRAFLQDRQYYPNPEILCRHCGEKGHVEEREGREKVGVSGGKLAAMFLTCGVSLVFTGLSRKQWFTFSRCMNCGREWAD